MRSKKNDLSPHSVRILDLLTRQKKPLSAYEILDRLRKSGIKAPPTVYRALNSLLERGLVHRIESLGAFVACHAHDGPQKHVARFAVCHGCGTVDELHDSGLSVAVAALSKSLKFHVEREILELIGLCRQCANKIPAEA